jgi:dihydrofolate synthase/folylpolyglutamate synthase
MSYQETLQYLYNLQLKGMKFGLSSMEDLLSLLDNPHCQIKSVHIGGTNGKGSTSAIIASVLQHAGYKVGLYTSPHLIDFSERISINSFPIPQPEVIRLNRFIQRVMKGRSTPTPTFFEWTTAMAFLYFAEQKVDIAIIEVGLGGRLDSTNVISPLLSVITNIDFDHQEILGNSLLEIGYEKAGIIKKNVPVISGIFQKEVQELILNIAKSLGAPLLQFGVDFNYRSMESADLLNSNLFDFHGIQKNELNLSLPLLGEHQKRNASLALAALEILHGKGFGQNEDNLRDGLKMVRWPGRIEVVKKNPLIILDGAHNPSGARVLASFLNSLPKTGNRILVLGMMKDKDIYQIGEALIPWADEIILTRASFSRAASPNELLKALPATLKPIRMIGSLSEIFPILEKKCDVNEMICFTGSLYTIGEAKAILEGVHIDVPLYG